MALPGLRAKPGAAMWMPTVTVRADVSGASIYTLSNEASSEAAARFAARENDADRLNGLAIEGTSEAMTVANDRVDYLLVDIDPVAAGRVGMPVADLQTMMRAQVEGVRAGIVADGVRRVPIVLRGDGARELSAQDFADLVYRELITQCQHQYPGQLHYQPIVTREAHSGALSKRLPELIQSGELQSACQQSLTNRSQVMLCGNPEMIKDTKATLESLGLKKNLRRDPGNITVEQYW